MDGQDYNSQSVGEILTRLVSRLGGVKDGCLDRGMRETGKRRGQSFRLTPTNSERLNRSLKELGPSAFKIHTLLWQWRGAPAKGHLPFFTVSGLSKFTSMSRPTVRSGLMELVEKGWIQKLGYDKHHKNELFRLIGIREVKE